MNKKPLSEAALQRIAENLFDSDEENAYEDVAETSGDNEFVVEENVSESDDDIEVQSEEEDDKEPEVDGDELNEDEEHEYIAKSGKKWTSKPAKRSTKRLKRNIVNIRPGFTPYSSNANSYMDFFNLFITDEIKDIICLRTNEEAERYFILWNEKHPDNIKKWRVLEKVELDCFLGILIKAGALRCRRESVKEMWTTDSSIRRSFFTASMPRDRFVEISLFMRFDDKLSRAERKKEDKLAAIAEVWSLFVENCKKSFVPYEHLTIDEQLVAFRGRCPFRQYIKSKPAKYGLKIWAVADVRTSYVCNLQMYTGKLPGAVKEQNQGYRVVKDLAEPYHDSGRSITTDNFFTSVALAEYLLTKNLTLLGTVRKNKRDTPQQLKIPLPEHSSRFAFTNDLTMVSYIPKKNRMVHLLSSQHNDESISREDARKPIMILDYNDTKGGVDNADKLIREYTCARRTARWPYRLFINILDICALNSYVMYIHKHQDWKTQSSCRRRLFLLKLGDDLVRKNMEIRVNNKKLHTHVKNALRDCGIEMAGSSRDEAVGLLKRSRCYKCPRKADKKSRVICEKCKRFVCENHRKTQISVFCIDCASNE